MSLSYYASKLSDNLGETPEGYLVAKDAVVARTGFQAYQVRDLPQDAAEDLGIDVSNPDASIDLYRSPEEVFSAATIASFEGKSITNEHPPAAEFVDPSNVAELECGHIQNIRKGEEPLESGEWPLIADVIIKREPLLGKVKSGQVRELSCGYDYALARNGDRLCQTAIRGNHVAVVPKGRAGAEARIKDSAPEQPAQSSAGEGSTGTKPHKEVTVTNILKHIFGLGLQAYAKDAEPEKLAEAAEAIKKEEKPAEVPKPAEEKKPAEEPKPAEKPAEEKKATDHRKRRADDCRSRISDRLRACEDADIEALEEYLDEFFEEEAEEPQHEGEGEEPPAEEEVVADALPADDAVADDAKPLKVEDIRKKRRAKDEFIQPVEESTESRSADTALEILNALRPVVARDASPAVRRAFNAQLGRFTRSSKASSGSYAAAASAAGARAADTHGTFTPDRNAQQLQEHYDAIRAGKSINKEDK